MNDFDLNEFLPFRLNRLAAELSVRLSHVYQEEFGLSIFDWRVLATLAGLGQSTAQEIVRSTRTHKSSISRSVNKLTQEGWIERVVDDQDRRHLKMRMTVEGRTRFEQILPRVLEFENSLLKELDVQSRSALECSVAELESILKLSN